MMIIFYFFFQAEDGIRVLVRSRGLGDVYRGQMGRDELLQGSLPEAFGEEAAQGGGEW